MWHEGFSRDLSTAVSHFAEKKRYFFALASVPAAQNTFKSYLRSISFRKIPHTNPSEAAECSTVKVHSACRPRN